MSAGYTILGFLGCGIFLGTLAWFCVAWHLGYTRMPEILKYFENSPIIKHKSSLRREGLMSMLLLIGIITGSVTFPKSLLKMGQLSSDDLSHLPRKLRNKLIVMHWTLLSLVAWLLVGGLLATIIER